LYYQIDTACYFLKIVTDSKIDYRVGSLPAILSFVEDDNPEIAGTNSVEPVASVAYSVKCTLDDFKSMCKFLYGKKCLVLYMAYITNRCNDNEFILRLSILTRRLIPEFAEFYDADIPVYDKFKV